MHIYAYITINAINVVTDFNLNWGKNVKRIISQ